MRSVLGAISSLPIVAFREYQSCVAKRSRLCRVDDWLRWEAYIAKYIGDDEVVCQMPAVQGRRDVKVEVRTVFL